MIQIINGSLPLILTITWQQETHEKITARIIIIASLLLAGCKESKKKDGDFIVAACQYHRG
jgi:hypothetical protein